MSVEGKVFGRLTVLERSHRNNKYNWYWKCRCECGKETIVESKHLRDGTTRSCGCLLTEYRVRRAEKAAGRRINRPKVKYDGDLVDRFYRTRNSYKAMIRRCYDPKFLSFIKYGAKGIAVCDRWRNGEGGISGWRCFLQDMGQRPDKHSLDRIDGTLGYFPENCRWATRQQQEANKRPTKPPPV